MKPEWLPWLKTRMIVAVVLTAVSMAISIAALAGSQPVALDQAAEVLVAQLAKKLKKQDIETMAVSVIEGPGDGSTELGVWLETKVGETLQRKLPQITLVERAQLDGLLEEQRLSESGLFDRRTTAKPGMMIGAAVMVTGEIFEKDRQTLSITLEAISVETSAHLAISTVDVDRTTVENHLLNTSPSRQPVGLGDFATSPSVTSGPIRFEAHNIRRPFHRKNVTAEVSFINLTEHTIFIGIEKGNFGRCRMNLRDDSGEAYLPVGDGRGSGIHCVTKSANQSDYTTLPPGEKTAGLSFKANKDEYINGEEFGVSVFLVQWTPDGQVRHALDISGLVLDTDD